MLKDYKVVRLVLKVINKPDYIRVLTHLKNVHFSSRLINFHNLHVSLSSCFERYSLPCLNMGTLEDFSELSLADGLTIQSEEVLNFR